MSFVSEAIKKAQTITTEVLDTVVSANAVSQQPTRKLSTQEQLNRYYRMKPEQFEVLKKKYGEAEVNEYVKAMDSIARSGM